ncbi:hypothetical protein [Palleronia sp. LCG004]|uniref:hypothetical protein n=1 Tax=Palleronia sp. LCG004 TaxID=3079304 RepID=UPI002943A22C|nr:hypothetical protein [Palleronia sp. LCG004]WOI55117.1 hypothetical protein RVY76_08590 [Palleronia sp. LCG004]
MSAGKEQTAATLGYQVWGLINVARLAHENDRDGAPLEQRGIDIVLELAGRMAGELVEQCERMEEKQEPKEADT